MPVYRLMGPDDSVSMTEMLLCNVITTCNTGISKKHKKPVSLYLPQSGEIAQIQLSCRALT